MSEAGKARWAKVNKGKPKPVKVRKRIRHSIKRDHGLGG